eukprot:scaffold28551_cov101-Isochrysis_galbana.AAC.1
MSANLSHARGPIATARPQRSLPPAARPVLGHDEVPAAAAGSAARRERRFSGARAPPALPSSELWQRGESAERGDLAAETADSDRPVRLKGVTGDGGASTCISSKPKRNGCCGSQAAGGPALGPERPILTISAAPAASMPLRGARSECVAAVPSGAVTVPASACSRDSPCWAVDEASSSTTRGALAARATSSSRRAAPSAASASSARTCASARAAPNAAACALERVASSSTARKRCCQAAPSCMCSAIAVALSLARDSSWLRPSARASASAAASRAATQPARASSPEAESACVSHASWAASPSRSARARSADSRAAASASCRTNRSRSVPPRGCAPRNGSSPPELPRVGTAQGEVEVPAPAARKAGATPAAPHHAAGAHSSTGGAACEGEQDERLEAAHPPEPLSAATTAASARRVAASTAARASCTCGDGSPAGDADSRAERTRASLASHGESSASGNPHAARAPSEPREAGWTGESALAPDTPRGTSANDEDSGVDAPRERSLTKLECPASDGRLLEEDEPSGESPADCHGGEPRPIARSLRIGERAAVCVSGEHSARSEQSSVSARAARASASSRAVSAASATATASAAAASAASTSAFQSRSMTASDSASLRSPSSRSQSTAARASTSAVSAAVARASARAAEAAAASARDSATRARAMCASAVASSEAACALCAASPADAAAGCAPSGNVSGSATSATTSTVSSAAAAAACNSPCQSASMPGLDSATRAPSASPGRMVAACATGLEAANSASATASSTAARASATRPGWASACACR